MFDTVRLKVRPVAIDSGILNQLTGNAVTFLSKETGALNTSYTIYDEQIPFIKYIESSQTLHIQVSIPKFLYGDNVTMLEEDDIPLFFDRLQERIQQLFHIHIPHSEWTVSRCDVCWNFQVGKNVGEYVRLLSKQQLAYKNTTMYNQDQTVKYWNKSSGIMFYDKHKQVTKAKESSDIIERAKGILRLEVNPSDSDMKKYASTRKAIELIAKPFFNYMTDKVLGQIEYPAEASNIGLSWLMENKENISKIETMLGFQMLQHMFDESTLRQIYKPSTYAIRKSTAKKMTIPKGNCLSPLAINS
ncbi:hypothetical protein M5X04_04350 [Paenibacillus alvei]|uniref:Uncharacterized protein n=1 Tax=Paenibacillus alvei TaxID=44250 RepID=A0ABT4E496_PAEAL|nr:hypothetical protein [Paenibacillus alvei]MCY9528567.1 hypothetical protein [Paenibacillus alvei]